MGLLSALIEKTHFYPLNDRLAGDTEGLRIQARGDGLYPLIKDGDILHVQQVAPSDLHVGDLTLCRHPNGEIAVQFVMWRNRKKASTRPDGNGVNGDERPLGTIATIEREAQRKRCDNRLARLAHVMYFAARPVIRIIPVFRRILSLLQPKFFVRDPESSLRSVAQKFSDPEEILHYSHRAFAGLDEQERSLVDRFMRHTGRILNIGCGAGREAFTLAELRFDVVGIDIAPNMIAQAKRHAQTFGREIQFEIKSATDLDYPAHVFDYVLISAGVYSHIPTRQLRIAMLRRINDLLTSNGTLFFSVLYRTGLRVSRISVYDAFRKIAQPILKERLRSEPGDILVRYVSPVGTPSKLCYVHFFKDPSEVLEEIALAGLDGFEDEKSGYWIVKRQSDATRREVGS